MKPAGYLETPLAKKLGIKNGFIMRLINTPDYYFRLFTDMPDDIHLLTDTETKKNFIYFFATKAEEIQNNMLLLRNEIAEDGIIWISWYKKSANMQTDITEDFIRDIALQNGLVDVKVCAVDALWSGLKLVIPLKHRLNKR